MASKISKPMAQQLVKALGNPSYEVMGARTNTERALADRGLIFHGRLREAVTDARGHQVRTHGMMLTDEGVKEAQRLAAEAAEERGEEPQAAEVDVNAPGQQYGGITREDVAKGNGPAAALHRAAAYFKMWDARQAGGERPAAVDVMRAEVESVSAVSEAFAARVRGEERPQEPDMAAMSEAEHASAFGERFAQVRRARMKEAQEGEEGFYVTAELGSRRAVLVGPYGTHGEALANVDRVRVWALDNDVTDAAFAGFGTARLVAKPGCSLRPGKFNDRIGLRAVKEGTVMGAEGARERVKRMGTAAGVLEALRAPHVGHGDAGDVEGARVFGLEVSVRVVSYRAESCAFAGEEDHECESDCTWLESDSRELEDRGSSRFEADSDDLEAFEGDAVAWAADYIRTKTDAVQPSVSPVGEELGEHEWLLGSSEDPYQGDERVTETTVRLVGDWTPQERARVFRAVMA